MRLECEIRKGEICIENDPQQEYSGFGTFNIIVGKYPAIVNKKGKVSIYGRFSTISKYLSTIEKRYESFDVVSSDVERSLHLTRSDGAVQGYHVGENVVDIYGKIHRWMDPKGYVELDNKKWLFNWHGKYEPDVTMIMSKPCHIEELPWREVSGTEINSTIDGRGAEAMDGSFRWSKNNNPVFDLTKRIEHTLIKFPWGGPFEKSRGWTDIPKEDLLYNRRASSNGGGAGWTYLIIRKGYRLSVSEDDI